ncbi:hypothetical protein SLS62_004687 [Diatrype stigma]|uniref:ribonuclease H n=1 Tax=Diatrype stigma TaxID=117547 RepID=A0AAN9UUG3_9PEZI
MAIGLDRLLRPTGLSLIRQLKTSGTGKNSQRWLSASRSLMMPSPQKPAAAPAAAAGKSENEDQPRIVLNVRRGFTLLKREPSITSKVHQSSTQQEGPNGELIPSQGGPAVHSEPIPADVARVKDAMGQCGNGVWTGSRFKGSQKPDDVFPVQMVNTSQQHVLERFCIRSRFAPKHLSPKTMLIYTDGACSNNNHRNPSAPRGGAAFVFNEEPWGIFSFALENRGPDGRVYPHTNNRAELRAVIAALQFRQWASEGWDRIVVATDSRYVFKGATEWLRKWASRKFLASGSSSKPVANIDLWLALSEALGNYAEAGCEVSFWKVPRLANNRADVAAKAAAERGNGGEDYRDTPGVDF